MLAALALAAAARAEEAPVPRHGIAMHGETRHGPGFRHLGYVDPDAPKGGEIRHAVTGSFDSLNPHAVRGRPAPGLGLVQLSLLRQGWDEPFSLYGLLAETVAAPEDRSWVEFSLRPEARWHDGRPVTPEDVIFSWSLLGERGRPGFRAAYARVERAERVGERGVRFAFAPGTDREMALVMGLMPILPRHWWEGRPFDGATLEPPLGGGPYRIASVEPGRSIAYERVRDWWGRDLPVSRGQHNFDRVRYDLYRDETAALEAFLAGDADFRRETDPARWARAYDVPAARDGRIRMEALPRSRPEPMRGFVYNTRRPPFDDRRVREALGLALDAEWIDRALFFGALTRTESFFPNSELAAAGPPSPAELELLEPWRAELPAGLFERPFALPRTDAGPDGHRANLRRADEALRAAGWTLRGGRRAGPQGRPLAFEILLADPDDERVALEFARGLARLGVEARVRTADGAQYRSRMDRFDFDMTVGSWSASLSPGTEQLLYWSSRAADEPGSRNLAGVRSPAVDALAAGLGEARTREELVTRARALDRALLWGHYLVPLHHLPEERVAYRATLARPATTPLYGLALDAWWSAPRQPEP